VRVLLWHGYLLSGSGSNIYTANLCSEWRKAGHDVLLLCQEAHGESYGWIDEQGGFAADNRSFETRSTGVSRGRGRCRLARPHIGEVLPVYVYDEYEGFIAKRFVDLSDRELDFYTELNTRALITAIREHEPDAIITGHEVMGPYIAHRACRETGTSYLAKLHGSALEYAVKLQDRFLRFATEGLCGARAVVGGSRYMVEEASAVVPGWEERAVVVNPGCDVEMFRPIRREPSPVSTVGYVGKLIASKGVHNLLVALGNLDGPLLAVIVGYGSLEDTLRRLADLLMTGDVERAHTLLEQGGDDALKDAARFLSSDGTYRERNREITITFTGRLEHEPLAPVIPTFDVLVVPSVVPEAFGMVAAEAAACGVLPVVPNHSGIGEAGAAVEGAIGRPGLLTYDHRDPVKGITEALERVLSIPHDERRDLGIAASELARSRWSWSHVAARLLELAAM
jgi:glycosyltransferase involved in cell wall biosynthesis